MIKKTFKNIMPRTNCSVKSCMNSKMCSKALGISFHLFPKEHTLKYLWTQFCNRGTNWDPKKYDVMCSEHFTKDDFEPLIAPAGFTKRKKLKKYAVPTIETAERAKRMLDLMDEDSQEESTSKSDDETPNEQSVLVQYKNMYESRISVLEQENKALRTQLEAEKQKSWNLEKSLKEYEKSTIILRQNSDGEVDIQLSPTINSNEINITPKYKYKKLSTSKQVKTASLSQYAEKITLSSGILTDVLFLMKLMVEKFTPKQRTTVLCFGETKVESIYEYDKKRDEILGPHNRVLVVMARGMYSNWKQPVYVGFDQQMTKELLLQIVSSLFNISLEVVAVVCDCGAANQRTYSDLGIDVDQVYFPHPHTEGKVFCFYDAPHLMTLIRYGLLNTGFLLENDVLIHKNVLEDLIKRSTGRAGSIYPLTENHVNTDEVTMQNICLATELLSHKTATAIKKYYNTPESNALADFIQLTNDWFDMFNVGNVKAVQTFKRPYEGNSYQIDKLEELCRMFTTMRCTGKPNTEVFQNAVVQSSQALHEFFLEMQMKFSSKFILTSKLNRNILEDLFSEVRTRGGLAFDPTPLNFMHHMRMIILGKPPNVATTNSNTPSVVEAGSEKYAFTFVFSRTEIEPAEKEDNAELEEQLEAQWASASSSNLERDGLNYLSGWLGRRFCGKYPELEMSAQTASGDEHCYASPSWVQELSVGGLAEESKPLVRSIKMLEWWFKKLNEDEFVAKKNVASTLLRAMKGKVDVPEEITEAFIKQRILIRTKKLNFSARNKNLKMQVPECLGGIIELN